MKATKIRNNRGLSLAPLNFDEAVTDLLKVKPPPKDKKPKARKKQTRRKQVKG